MTLDRVVEAPADQADTIPELRLSDCPGGVGMKRVAVAAAVVLALAVIVAAPAGARKTTTPTVPGAWCGGSLWKLMTLSDTGKAAVNLSPTGASIADLAKLSAPTKILASRNTSFVKQAWSLTAVIERYRVQSNGEIALELFDVPTSTYMDAYMPNPKCLSSKTRDRAQILAARSTFTKVCPAPQGTWQPLGATVQLAGVGFWNPVRTTLGALQNGAELRPVTYFNLMQGCGKY